MDSGKELGSLDIPTFRGMNILTPVVYNESVFTSSYGGEAHLIRFADNGADWDLQQAWTNRKLEAWGSEDVWCVL